MDQPPTELEFRRKAEVCRSLAVTAETAERRDLWLARAAEWDAMASEALRKAAARSGISPG
jgi:hypothetical protein